MDTKMHITKMTASDRQHLNGEEVVLIRVIDKPEHDMDSEALPVYRCRVKRTGEDIDLWPDEVDSRAVNVTLPVSRELMNSIMTTAVEGGISYWAGTLKYRWQDRDTGGDLEVVELEIAEFDENESVPSAAKSEHENLFRGAVTHDMVAEGIRRILSDEVKVAHQYRAYVLQGVIENDGGHIDADAADAVIQAAVLGEIRYG